MCARLEIRTGRLAHTRYVASRRARAVRAKYRLAGLTKGLRTSDNAGLTNWSKFAVYIVGHSLLSLHNPVARAARALAGRYTGDRPNLSRARRDILVWQGLRTLTGDARFEFLLRLE